jgi:hypothetical protein
MRLRVAQFPPFSPVCTAHAAPSTNFRKEYQLRKSPGGGFAQLVNSRGTVQTCLSPSGHQCPKTPNRFPEFASFWNTRLPIAPCFTVSAAMYLIQNQRVLELRIEPARAVPTARVQTSSTLSHRQKSPILAGLPNIHCRTPGKRKNSRDQPSQCSARRQTRRSSSLR